MRDGGVGSALQATISDHDGRGAKSESYGSVYEPRDKYNRGTFTTPSHARPPRSNAASPSSPSFPSPLLLRSSLARRLLQH